MKKPTDAAHPYAAPLPGVPGPHALTIADINPSIDQEPRIKDVRLGDRLGMAQPLDIRRTIETNRAELEGYGQVFAQSAKTSAKGGRPATEYWLNEPQALLLCMLARTPAAAAVRRELIAVFMAHRRGERTPPAAPAGSVLSIACSDPADALAKARLLVEAGRAALAAPGAADGAALILGMACDGITAVLDGLAPDGAPIANAVVDLPDPKGVRARAGRTAIERTGEAGSGEGELDLDRYLVQVDLTELDRAVYLAKRHAAYEKLHPETRQGKGGGLARHGLSTGVPSFIKAAAKQLGCASETVSRLVKIGRNLSAELRERIAGTWLADNQTQLMALVRAPARVRPAIVNVLLDEAGGVKTVAEALRRLSGGEG